jgi:hypothetical protein
MGGHTGLSDVTEVAALKERFNDIHVIGSGDLARSLLEADLVACPRRSDWCSRRRRFQKGAISPAYERAGAPVTGIDISQG